MIVLGSIVAPHNPCDLPSLEAKDIIQLAWLRNVPLMPVQLLSGDRRMPESFISNIFQEGAHDKD